MHSLGHQGSASAGCCTRRSAFWVILWGSLCGLGLYIRWLREDILPLFQPSVNFEMMTDDQLEKRAIQMVKFHKSKGFTIMTAANNGHQDFVLNWAESLSRTGHTNFIIFCLDFQLCRSLMEKTQSLDRHLVVAPRRWVHYNIPSGEHKWLEPDYKNLVEAKMRIQVEILKLGHRILFSDADVVFASPYVVDHINYILGNECKIDDALDSLANSTCVGDIAYMADYDSVNTGFFAARPTPMIIKVMEKTIQVAQQYASEQHAFGWVVEIDMKIKPSRAFRPLDSMLYPNGLIFFNHQKPQQFHIKPMVVHANFHMGKTKRDLFRMYGYWYI